jgi:dephospho-CoA kinase
LAAIIFGDSTALQPVNRLVHPAVARDFEQWCGRQTSLFVLEESAIIFENGMTHRFDRIILVTAPCEVRIERVCARDGVTPEAVRQRMKHQWPEEKKTPLADYTIINDGLQSLMPQVDEIHRLLLSEAARLH